MKVIKYLCGTICCISLILILLISSFEIVIYGHKSFYQHEYVKYNVIKDISMELKDILYVTDEMLDYLRGNRDDLTVYTTIKWEEKEFFNEKEKAHMHDVQNLFLAGISLRVYSIICFIVALGFPLILKLNWKYVLAKSFQVGSLFIIIFVALLSLIISTNFTKYFDIFHKLFFDNDLYLLDPNTDLLINILPEGFFIDISIEIGIVFVVTILPTFILSSLYIHYYNIHKLNQEDKNI